MTCRGFSSILILFLAPLLGAQEKSFSTASSDFQRGFKARDHARRVAAIAALANTPEPRVIGVFLEANHRTRKTVAKLEKDLARLHAEIAEEIDKRVTRPRMEPGDRQRARELVESQLAPKRAKVARIETSLSQERELVEKLRAGIRTCFDSLDEEVRPKGARYIVDELRRRRKPEERIDVLRSMAYTRHPLVVATLVETARRSLVPSERVACLNALALHPVDSAESACVFSLGDDFWQVRAAALEALRKIGTRTCVPALIERLETERGRILGDLTKTLRHLTKVDHHDNVTLWKRWWKDNEALFEGRGALAGVPGRQEQDSPGGAARRRGGRRSRGETSFYGITTRSKDIVYVLDVSGSMNQGEGARGRGEQAPKGKRRIDIAVRELTRSIQSLPSTGSFNIIFYAGNVSVWKKKMQKADARAKQEAIAWARQVTAAGWTNIYDSLERAFGFAGRGTFDRGYEVAVETIFLLSDGNPNRGRFTNPRDILREVKKLNELKKVEVNTVALGRFGGNRFLRQLASENGGQYVQVR